MLDRKGIFALLVAATMLSATSITLNPLIQTTHQARATLTRNPATSLTQTTWIKTYGGLGDDEAFCVQQTSDGGYIATGFTRSFGVSMYDFWLVKTDSAGDEQWSRSYGGNYSEEAYSVQQTADGGYIVAGWTYSFGAGGVDCWLVKTNSSGSQQWNKTYGGINDDYAESVQQTADGGYTVAGSTDSSGAGSYDFWLVKTDDSGNQQWNKTYGGTSSDQAYSVQQTADGGYIMAGYTRSFGAGRQDFWLVKTDPAGNHQWNKTYGGTDNDWASSVQQTSDGGYIAAGRTRSFGAGGVDFWLVKADSSGNHQWNKTYGGTGIDDAYSVQQASDGGYITAGYTESFGAGFADLWLVKVDSTGNMQWNKTYGGTWYDYAFSVQETSDGGYITAGQTSSFGAHGCDFWLVKTDASGETVEGTPLIIIAGVVALAAAVVVLVAVVLMKKRRTPAGKN